MTHTAKLFRNGRSQAVRLPAEYRFEGTQRSMSAVTLRRAMLSCRAAQTPGRTSSN